MRFLVTGDRNWTNEVVIRRWLAYLHGIHPDAILVEGDARGADQIAGRIWYALTGTWDQVEAHPADWNRYKKAAGPIRNQFMLDESKRRAEKDGHHLRFALAFHPNLAYSKGTLDMTKRLTRAGIPFRHVTGLP
jgi:hypothetical protein